MQIAVFIKQVPDNTKLKLEDGGSLNMAALRDSAPAMMNPYDEYALETALRLKDQAGEGTTVTVITLGPASAKESLKKALAAGADDALHLCDDPFANGDATANARALARTLQQTLPEAKVLIFGQMSLDEARSQTGPMVAELLELPCLTFGKNAELVGDKILVTRETERGLEKHETELPSVLCMMKCDYELRSSNIKGVMKANKAEIPVKTANDLGLDPSQVGAGGAVTQVTKTWKRPEKEGGRTVDGSDPQQAVNELIGFLKEAKVL